MRSRKPQGRTSTLLKHPGKTVVEPRNPNCNECGVKKTPYNTYLRRRRYEKRTDDGKLYYQATCMQCTSDRKMKNYVENLQRSRDTITFYNRRK